jgi:hypothetical protein
MKPNACPGLIAGVTIALASIAAVRQTSAVTNPPIKSRPTTTLRVPVESIPVPTAGRGLPSQHPLQPALIFAGRANQYARDHVRDYTCLLVKRERIEGDLRDAQYIQTKVRTELMQGDQVVQPYSVFLSFSAPAQIAGRKVVYVQGRNDNKMLVRNGGKRFNYVTVKLDPTSEAALRETLVPITGIGFANVTESLVTLIQQDMRRDPLAANTKVKFFRNAKVNGRVCTRISVLHPQPDPSLEFSEADVYVDDELRVPIRIEAYLWPKTANEAKPLLFEYTYTQLQLNVGLSDADFSPSVLERKR